jgi:hypothetical protein
MEIPPPDPAKLLQSWMEWERGEVTPGRVMANLKTGGLRELLERLAAGQAETPTSEAVAARPSSASGRSESEPPSTEPATWEPVV